MQNFKFPFTPLAALTAVLLFANVQSAAAVDIERALLRAEAYAAYPRADAAHEVDEANRQSAISTSDHSAVPESSAEALSDTQGLPQTHSGTIVRVGMLDFESEASYLSRVEDIQETVLSHLARTTPGIVIEPIRYKTRELAEAVRKGEVEFFLGSSGFFVEMRPYGVRDIGTIVSRSFPDPNQCVAGVIFVRKDRVDLQTIKDLKGRVATSTDPRNFMTFQIGMGEIERAGFNPDKFFSRIDFTNSVPTAVVENVVSGRADVGLLRACMLEAIEESHPQWRDAFRVIGERKGPRAERLGCRYSTDMYPGWTFAVMPHTPPILTRHVAISLLSMDPQVTASGFAVSYATNYASVNDLFRRLRIGPYAYLRDWTVARVLHVSWPFLLLAAGLALAWVLHWLRLEKLVRRRTAALELAWAKEKAAQAAAAKAGEKLDRLQRVSLVGELSSIFAHELGQPLSAMRYYARSLMTLSKQADADRSLVRACLEGLQNQITNAGRILEHVRSYAKQGASRDNVLDLSALAASAVEELRQSQRLHVEVEFRTSGPVHIEGDEVELRILVHNLVKNAAEAASSSRSLAAHSDSGAKPHAPVRVTVDIVASQSEAAKKRAEIRVENDGDVLSPEALTRLDEPLATNKKEGLGLGLLICKSIAEAHRAKLLFEARPLAAGGGLLVRFRAKLHEPTPKPAGVPKQITP